MMRVENLTFSVGNFSLKPVSFQVGKGEYFVLLGPPGSGKSIFLECICGLNRPESGRIFIGDRDVTGLSPRRRRIGYVPQDYALFPHLSVENNIGFGLLGTGLADTKCRNIICEKAALMGIEHLLKRRITGLSGGEKQRVALARALCISPEVLLLDEPVSALDESTRESVCARLRKLQRELSITTIQVSHNLEEAFSVADRGGVLQDGNLRQTGTMAELLRRPDSEFIARFMRCGNLLKGKVSPRNGSHAEINGIGFELPTMAQGEVTLVIRPENVAVRTRSETVSPTVPPVSGSAIPCRLGRCVDLGAYMRVELQGPIPLTAHVSHREYAGLISTQSSELFAVINRESIHVIG